MDWRLTVNCVLGILATSGIVLFLRGNCFHALKPLACFSLVAVSWYTFSYGAAMVAHITPEALTMLLRPFTGVILAIIGITFVSLRLGNGKLWQMK